MPVEHKCPTCSKLFTRSTTLRDHIRSHAREYRHKCNICGRAFVRNSDRKDHEKTHTQDYKYLCRRTSDNGSLLGCSAGFHRKYDLHRHWKRAAAGAKCQIGPFTLTTEDLQAADAAAALYDLAFSIDNPSGIIETPDSPAVGTPIRAELTTSIRPQSSTDKDIPSITTSRSQFEDGNYYERPAATSNPSKPPYSPVTFSCSLCLEKFSRNYNLWSHVRAKHTDTHPFVCFTCAEAFGRQVECRRHEDSHSAIKQFICGGEPVSERGKPWGCGRRFQTVGLLYRHFESDAGRSCVKLLLNEGKKLEDEKKERQDRLKKEWKDRLEYHQKMVDDQSKRLDEETPARVLLANAGRHEPQIYRIEDEKSDNEVVDYYTPLDNPPLQPAFAAQNSIGLAELHMDDPVLAELLLGPYSASKEAVMSDWF